MHLEYTGERPDGVRAVGSSDRHTRVHDLANTLVLDRHWRWAYVRTAPPDVLSRIFARDSYRSRRLRELEDAAPRPGDYQGGPVPWEPLS